MCKGTSQSINRYKIIKMKGFCTILLLIVSNVFMTFAWYGHLKMKQEYSWFAALPLIGVIAFSWSIAFLEYNKIEKPNWEFNTLR